MSIHYTDSSAVDFERKRNWMSPRLIHEAIYQAGKQTQTTDAKR